MLILSASLLSLQHQSHPTPAGDLPQKKVLNIVNIVSQKIALPTGHFPRRAEAEVANVSLTVAGFRPRIARTFLRSCQPLYTPRLKQMLPGPIADRKTCKCIYKVHVKR